MTTTVLQSHLRARVHSGFISILPVLYLPIYFEHFKRSVRAGDMVSPEGMFTVKTQTKLK